MGALSSWAMLATTHHVIVQVAARRAGVTGWFDKYAVLGDDIVIVGESVAKEYHSLITEHLGCKISLHKSIVSQSGLLEFAKRFHSFRLGDLSPLSPKALNLGVRQPGFLPNLLCLAASKGLILSVNQVVLRLFKAVSMAKLSPRRSAMVASAILTVPFLQALANLPGALSPSASWTTIAFGQNTVELRRFINDRVVSRARREATNAHEVLLGNLRTI